MKRPREDPGVFSLHSAGVEGVLRLLLGQVIPSHLLVVLIRGEELPRSAEALLLGLSLAQATENQVRGLADLVLQLTDQAALEDVNLTKVLRSTGAVQNGDLSDNRVLVVGVLGLHTGDVLGRTKKEQLPLEVGDLGASGACGSKRVRHVSLFLLRDTDSKLKAELLQTALSQSLQLGGPFPSRRSLPPNGAEVFSTGSLKDQVLPRGLVRISQAGDPSKLPPLTNLSTEFCALPTGFDIHAVEIRPLLSGREVDDERHVLADIGHLFVHALGTVPDGISMGVEGKLDGDLVEPVLQVLTGLHISNDPVSGLNDEVGVGEGDPLGSPNDPVEGASYAVLFYSDDPLDRP